MMELEYIPLKTAEGVTCGHAKVRSGTVELSLRPGQTGEAVVLTDGGSFTGSPGARIHTAGRVQAVAVREGDALRCCGLARRSAYTVSEVRLRLSAQTAQKPKPDSTQPRLQREEPAQQRPTAGEIRAPEPQQTKEPQGEEARQKAAPPEAAEQGAAPLAVPERIAEDGLPFHPDTAVKQALSRLAEETAAAFMEEVRSEPAWPERLLAAADPALSGAMERTAAHTLEDTAADTEAFSALMARADAVFAKIDTPVNDGDGDGMAGEEGVRTDPTRTDPARTDPAGRDPARRDPVWRDPVWRDPVWRDPVRRDSEDWCGAVDRLLHTDAAEPGRIPVQNPFPHIFPGARFFKESGGEPGMLRGEWVSGRERMTVTAVRGDYSPKPPESLPGFTRYIRARSGGYWVKVDGADT